MAVTTGSMTSFESSCPRRPTSITANSTRARQKMSNAMAVVASKNVGVAGSVPSASADSIARCAFSAACRSSRAFTGRPSTTNRSERSMRWGDV